LARTALPRNGVAPPLSPWQAVRDQRRRERRPRRWASMPSRATAAVPTPTQPGASSPTAAPSRVAPENTLTAFRIAA